MSERLTNKEFRNYIIWGTLSAIINIGGFHLLNTCGLDYRISNTIALVASRFFCYITNKHFVFQTKCRTKWELVKEVASFVLARTVTFFMDYLGVILLVEIIGLNTLLSKIIMAIIVIITNYIFSKFLVFRKHKTRESREGNETNYTDSLLQ